MLLSHLDISDARQVPTGMFEFVNETLTSSYPPDQRNVITSMWLLRTLTRLIDECPVELSENVLELLQEGLSAWISDEFSALTVQEYELDILALYQTVLMRMRSLSLSLPTLETLSPVLCAAFIGRSDKPDGAKEAFSEYWQATYDLRQDLVESLPEKVVMALDILHNRSEASSLAHLVLDDTASVGEVDDMLVPESEDEDETEPSTPKAKTRDLASAFFPRQASAQDGSSANPFEIMSTPPSSSCSSPPRRPHKTPKVFDLTSDTPPTSPSRAPPVTPTKKSPEHRRTSSGRSMPNKENVSPLPVFDSIAERIAASISPGPSTLGKRRAPDEEADDSLKRHKRSESLSMMFQEGASPEMMPDGDVPSTPNRALPPRLRKMAIMGSPRLTQTLPTMKSKRRNKSVFMDAVEIASTPGLRKRSSQESISSVDSKRATIPLRRTRSSTRLAENAVIPVAGPSTRKRRRGSFDADDHAVQTPSKRSVTASSSRSSSPSRSTFDPIAFGSDDSIMMATPSRARSPMQDMSSDDDPHIGQVTPHRLVSPAMRRVQNDDSDPPSDDSVLAASPTRDHVARRRSAGKAMIEKLAPLMLGKHHRTQSKDLTSGFFKSPRRE
ncbi:hypothetical protein EUX98_g5073 [Antrodiella citrinella]|uniref:Uncharacterized protein n=1 Tax=Antrodiella citrinella TaxID=2447956 RepID=A0A4S4MSN1_9APHY|nr:hypothetical protein EUX98_g5073 [Antrodiella citrinella]